jgi:hypothetical protein
MAAESADLPVEQPTRRSMAARDQARWRSGYRPEGRATSAVYDPHGTLILTLQQVSDDRCGVCLGWVSLDICQTRPAEIAKHQMHIYIKGRD